MILKLGLTNRTSSELLLPGGKGINVSTILTNLGIESTALGFVAGFTGDEIIRKVEEIGVRSDFIRIEDGISRINVKLKSIDGTEINGMGPDISQEKTEELMKKLDVFRDSSWRIEKDRLGGSIGRADDIYSRIMERLEGKGVTFVVDATGELLLNVLKYHPFLIKPNNHELGDIFGVKLKTREEVVPYGRKLQEMGAKNVLIPWRARARTRAEDGSVYETPAPKGVLVNAVGSGDSMVAGFTAGWMEKKDYRHAFYMGVASEAPVRSRSILQQRMRS